MSVDLLEETQRFLSSEAKELNIVVMPDFFLDRLIDLDQNGKTFCGNLTSVINRKGGSIDGVKQTNIRGGNAVNTASALAALGVNVTPIICTDRPSAQLLKVYLKSSKLDFSHLKTSTEPSVTTALEFKTNGGKANVMLRDVGALASFGPHSLNKADFKTIESADYLCVFNWAGTKQFGTKLAEEVFGHVKRKGRGKTYFDTADPTPNAKNIPQLVNKVLKGKCVDILSVNENEAVCYASVLSNEMQALRKRLRFDELAKEAARILATQLTARVDLHTTNYSSTFVKDHETTVLAFKVPVQRATGAGDTWNAGNILGDANKLSDGVRLTLANAIAAYYISNPRGTHPSRKQLISFCQKTKQVLKSRRHRLS